MTRRLAIVLLLSSAAFGQSWSGILATSRAINWGANAGLPATFLDGETTTNPWTPPTSSRASCGTVSTLTNINTVLATCHTNHPNGGVVTLAAGTYNLTSANITFGISANNVTLRGAGPMSTKIILDGSAQIQMGLGSSTAGGGVGAKLTASPAAGATTFTIGSVTGGPLFGVGNIITLIQCNTGQSGTPNPSGGGCTGSNTDNGGIFLCGNTASCNIDGVGTNASQGQTVLVTNMVNNGNGTYTLTVSPGLYMSNWSTASSVGVFWNDPGFSPVGTGLENLTVETKITDTAGPFSATACYSCWVTGVRFVGKGASGGNVAVLGGSSSGGPKNFLFANNYIFAEVPSAISGDNTLSFVQSTDSDDLILNNIFEAGFAEGQGANEGVVYAYNFMVNVQTSFLENAQFQHHPGSAFELMEGNQFGAIRDDDTWGTHNLNTFFRNYLFCFDTPYIGGTAPLGLQIGSFARFENAIGNAIGDAVTGGCSSYQSVGVQSASGIAFDIADGPSDPLTSTSLMRWGNVTAFSQASDTPSNSGIRFVSSEVPSSLSAPNVALSNPVPANNSLPASFFMNSATAHPSGGTGLSWWKVCTSWTSFPSTCAASTTQPFPTAGPDVPTGATHVVVGGRGYAYDNPAALAWRNLPIDTAYQNSYSITGSSWAGGTETLTVSMPSSNHLLGGFQITGVAACNSPAGSEFLMTNSSATTISYALASNPGSCSGGTVKWPNVRQFDSGVFQADPAGGAASATLTPASLTYGNTIVGQTSASQAATLTSNGTSSLIVSTVSASGDFSVSSTSPSPCGTLAAGATCTINVIFSPTAVGSRTGTLTVTDNASTSPQTLSLSGTGTAQATMKGTAKITGTATIQ